MMARLTLELANCSRIDEFSVDPYKFSREDYIDYMLDTEWEAAKDAVKVLDSCKMFGCPELPGLKQLRPATGDRRDDFESHSEE